MTKQFKAIFFLACFLTTFNVISQIDTLNRLTDKGKKTGYWMEYFDKNVLPTDSSNAFFYGFQYYDNGQKLFSFQRIKNKLKMRLESNTNLPPKGKPILLNGNFKWFKDSIIQLDESYANGRPVLYKVYKKRNLTNLNEPMEIVDFTKLYNNIPNTFHYTLVFSNADASTYFWYYKDKKRWDTHRIKQ